jgi:hypothetical protein
MQIHAIVIAALISLAAAIPGITNVYAPPSEDKKLEKRGPRTIAITTAALPTLFGPAVTRWYNNVFGVQAAPVSQTAGKRDLVDAHLAPALSWDDARAAFIQKTVDDVFKLYVDPSKEAAVCAGTSYTVGRPAATVAFNSYRFNHDGKTQEYVQEGRIVPGLWKGWVC